MSLRQGEVKTAVIQVTNKGTAPIKGLTVTTTESLPFVAISDRTFGDIMPVNKGYSIRAEGGRASIVVAVSPSDSVKAGRYEGEIVLNSNAGEKRIPIIISVGNERVATCIFEVRDNNQTPLANANVMLSGIDESMSAIQFNETTNADGQIRLENIPAGNYSLKVKADYNTTLDTSVEIPAVINPVPQVINLERQLFAFDYDESTIEKRNQTSTSSADYDNLVFKAKLLAESTEPQLLPNFPADEKEFYYQSGKLLNKISFKNPSKDTKLENVTVQIVDIDDRIPENAIGIRAETGVTPIKDIGIVSEQSVIDIVWQANIDKFFGTATVSKTENDGEYRLVFPSDANRDVINAYVAANDPTGSGIIKEISFDESTNSGIYRVRVNNDGSFTSPSDRVPYLYGDKIFEFDFKLLITGTVSGTQNEVKTTIPVRMRYISPDYYVNANSQAEQGDKLADIYDIHPEIKQNIAVEPLFAPSIGTVAKMSYSSGFLKKIGMEKPNVPENLDGAMGDFGFANETGFAEQVTNISFNLVNPSKLNSMENLEIHLVISDAGYDENGELLEGGNVIYPNLKVDSNGISEATQSIDGITNGKLSAGGKLSLNYSLKLDEVNDIYSALRNNNPDVADIFGGTNVGKVFARIEGSFDIDGKKHTFTTTPREYKVLPKPKLFVSYSLEGPKDGVYLLKATISNLGEGEARGVYVNKPVLPNFGFEFKVIGGSCEGGLVNGLNGDTIEIGTIGAGRTVVAQFELVAVGNVTPSQLASLGRLANMPALPVKSSINVGMVVAPMMLEAMNSVTTKVMVEQLNEELDKLQINIGNVTDKTASELARSILDNWEYARQLTGAVGITKSYDLIANFVSLVAIIKKATELPKTMKNYYEEAKKSYNVLVKAKELTTEQIEKLSVSQLLINKAKDGIDEVMDSINELDYGKVITAITKDIVNTSKKLEEYKNTVDEYANVVKLGPTFEKYQAKMILANQALENSNRLIDQIIKSSDVKVRETLGPQALADFKTAKQLFDEAKEIKEFGGGVLADVISMVEQAQEISKAGVVETISGNIKETAIGYLDSFDKVVSTKLQSVYLNLQLISTVDKVESKVSLIKNAGSAISSVAASVDAQLNNASEDEEEDEASSDEEDVYSQILESIGYDKAATVLDKYNALRDGYTSFRKMVTSAIDVYDKLKKGFDNLMDVSQLDNIVKTTPEMVKNLGGLTQVIKTTPNLTPRQIADKTFEAVFHSPYDTQTDVVKAKFVWFIDEFVGNYPNNETQKNKDIYTIKEAIKLHGFSVIDPNLYERNLEKAISSGKSEYRAAITAARDSATSKKTLYAMMNGVELDVDGIKALLQSYISGSDMTAYYPAKQLLAYLKGLNSQLRGMYTYNNNGQITNIPINSVGKYRNLWTYDTNGMDLVPKEIKMGDIYKSQQQIDHLFAEGYGYIADRHLLNMIKHYETGAQVTGAMIGMFGASPAMAAVGSALNVAGTLMDTSEYYKSLDTLDDQVLSYLAVGMADLAVNTSAMINKETNIASDVNAVFTTMDKWRKVDPPLPLELATMQATDVVLENGASEGYTNVVISIKNEHTGAVMISPIVEIYDSYGLVNSASIESDSIEAGATKEFSVKVLVPHNALRDSNGYMAVVKFGAAEADTMTIATANGPYVACFNANSQATLTNIRSRVIASQPMGGTLKVNEARSIVITPKDSNNSLRIFKASLPGESDIKLSVKNASNEPINATTLMNNDDFVIINGNLSSTYTIEVVNVGSDEQSFALQVVEAPYFGAVAGIYTEGVNVLATKLVKENETDSDTLKASIPISIYETGLREALTNIKITVNDLTLSTDSAIKIPASSIEIVNLGDKTKTTIAQGFTIESGKGRRLVANIYPANNLVDGEYIGSIAINLSANSFDLANSPYIWTNEADGSYTFTLPIKVKVLNTEPIAPTLNAVKLNSKALNTVVVSGNTMPNEEVYLFVTNDDTKEGVVKAIAKANENGLYEAEFMLDNERWAIGITAWVYAKTISETGIFSVATPKQAVVIKAFDITPPEIEIISPISGYISTVPISKIEFKLFDAESRLNESMPIVNIDGILTNVTYNSSAEHFEAVPQVVLGNGTHKVTITAENEIGLSKIIDYSFNVGGAIDTTFVVEVNNRPVENANITINGKTLLTNTEGKVETTLANCEYEYVVMKDGYLKQIGKVIAGANNNVISIALVEGYKLTFNVSSDNNPIANAEVKIGQQLAITGPDGVATFILANGAYSFAVTKNGYKTVSGSTAISNCDKTENIIVQTNSNASFTVVFTVKNTGGSPITNALIAFDGENQATDSKGQTVFSRQNGIYSFVITKNGYIMQDENVKIDGNVVNKAIELISDDSIKRAVTFNVKSDLSALANANVKIGEQNMLTDDNGVATFTLPNGTYTYSVAKDLFITKTGKFTVQDEDITIDVVTMPKAIANITISELVKPYTGYSIMPNIEANNLNYEVQYEGINGTVYEKTTVAPTQVGIYNVVVTINDFNYYGSKTAVLEIKKKVKHIIANIPSGLAIIATKLKFSTETARVKIYYTTNGDNPTTASTQFIDAITITEDVKTVKAIAVFDGMIDSDVFILELLPSPLYDGNVNSDDKIDMLDAFKILKYSVKLADLTEPQKIAADANKDGKINILDALLIQRYAMYYSENN